MNAFDVAVVGAGPAGATAALHLARAGRSVIVLDKAAWPRVKVCGGGVLARARRHLPADVEFPVERACRRVEMNFLAESSATSGEHDRTFSVVREETVVHMTMRADLDAALARAATEAGAVLRTSCTVEALTTREPHVEVATTHDVLRVRFVVVADGATGRCAKLAGWDAPLATIPALEAEVRVAPDDLARFGDVARFDFGGPVAGGYGWVFGKREHLSCGVLSMRRGPASLHDRLARYLSAVGLQDVGLRDADATDVRGYVIPIRPRAGGFAHGRVLLAGDAAGLADPVTAEGISLAMHSGRLAAEAILASPHATANDVARAREDARVGRAYDRAIRRHVASELRVARALASLLYRRPRWARALFERAGPSLCEAMADVCLGTRTYRELVGDPRNWVKLLTRRDRSPSTS